VLAALPVFAQLPLGRGMRTGISSPATPAIIPRDQQATEQQIRKYFEVTRERRQLQQVLIWMPTVIEQQFQEQLRNIAAKLPPGKGITPPVQAALEKVRAKYIQRANEVFPIERMEADIIPVYQRHISRADADTLIEFYRSPPAQRMLDAEPIVMSDIMAIEMPLMQLHAQLLTNEMSAEMQKLFKPELATQGATAPSSNAPAPASKK
jgi:hypothetical protein